MICPSAVTSVADRVDVPASLPVFPRLLSLERSRLHDRSAIVALSATTFVVEKKNREDFLSAVMLLCGCRSFHWQGLASSVLSGLIQAG